MLLDIEENNVKLEKQVNSVEIEKNGVWIPIDIESSINLSISSVTNNAGPVVMKLNKINKSNLKVIKSNVLI